MATPKFITVENGNIGQTKTWRGLVQHIRTMSPKDTYEYLAEALGYKAAEIRAAFLGLKQFICDNAKKSNNTCLDNIVTWTNLCKGSFATQRGPWVKGKNYVAIGENESGAWKLHLGGIIPVNSHSGVQPSISSVLDEVTEVYDIITGTDSFSIAGTDLAPDMEMEDEYVGFVNEAGAITKAVITESALQVVKAHLEESLPAGKYTLIVQTRAGYGEEASLKSATRKITIA